MDEYPEEMEITWKKIQNENEIILAVGDKVHYEDEKRFSVDHSREGNEIECIKAVSVLKVLEDFCFSKKIFQIYIVNYYIQYMVFSNCLQVLQIVFRPFINNPILMFKVHMYYTN